MTTYTVVLKYRNVEIGQLVYEVTGERLQGRIKRIKIDSRYAAIKIRLLVVLKTNPTLEVILGGWIPDSLKPWYDGAVKAVWVVSQEFQGLSYEAPAATIEEPEGTML